MIPQEKPTRSIKLKSRILPILVLVLVGLQLFFPFKGWAILLAGFGGLWFMSFLWARSLLKGLHIEREMRFGWKQVGDRLRERIVLENKNWAPSLWVEVDDHSTMNEYDISSVTDVRGYRRRNWYTQGFCDMRGLYTLGPVTLHAQDPFGIYEVSVDYTDSANMMVAPPVIDLPKIDIASGGRVGEGRSSNKGVEQTISTIGVREYVSGDSLRFLHWPTIARMGDLYVHLFDNEPSSDWWVLLDMDPDVHVGEGSRSTVEHGVILAASLVNRGLQRGKHVGLVSYSDDLIWHPPDIGNSHLWTILRSLATIHPGGPSLEQTLARLRTSLDQNTSLVIITSNLSPEWINALELLKRSGIITTVMILDPVSFGGSGDVEPFLQHLRKLSITHYTISADLLDQPKKRPQGLRWLIEQTRLRGTQMDPWDVRWQKFRRFLRTWSLMFVFFFFMVKLLSTTVRGMDTGLIWFLIAGGLAVGWLLARSSLPGWLAALLGGLFGIGVTIIRVGRLGGPLYRIFGQIIDILRQIFARLYLEGESIRFESLQSEWGEVSEGFSVLTGRLGEWLTAEFFGQPYFDPVAITIVWGLAVWGVVAWAMWVMVRRNKPLPALIPAIFMVMIALALSGHTSLELTFMFGSTIALMAFINHDTHESIWEIEKLSFTETIRSQMVVVVSALTIGLMVLSWIAPRISLDELAVLAQQIVGTAASDTEFAQSLGIENLSGSQEIDILDARLKGGLPNEHLIDSGPELSDQTVLVVQVDTSSSVIPDDQLSEVLSPIYLRSLVYDRYTGFGWTSRETDIVDYAPGDVVPSIGSRALPVRQQVQFVEDIGGIMLTLGRPLSADQDFRVAWRIQNANTQTYDIFGATIDGETYRADSLVQIHSVDELRSAGQNYPGWMISRYMSLPDTVPESVLALARDLTATETNPYNRAVAIENYLRQFPYNLDVPTVPAGFDVAEYFLFTLQEGYCDYYATAMVVLARAAGIPARYVIGYIGEYYDESIDAYVITADQAHAWPEIYFPGYGWVQFEPTGGRPEIKRPPEALPELPEDFELEFNPLVPEKSFAFGNWAIALGLMLSVAIFLTLLAWRLSDLRLARLPVERLLPKLFRSLYRYARWMGLPSKPGETPYEFSAILKYYLQQLSTGSYWYDWLQAGLEMIDEITHAYVFVTFYPASRSSMDSKALFNVFQQLRWRLWIVMFLGWAYKYKYLRKIFWMKRPPIISLPVEEKS